MDVKMILRLWSTNNSLTLCKFELRREKCMFFFNLINLRLRLTLPWCKVLVTMTRLGHGHR